MSAANHSPLTFLVFHSATPGLDLNRPSWIAREWFWSLLETGVLSFLLEQGADPNADCETSTTFEIYLSLSVSLNPSHQQNGLYIQGLRQFLKVGTSDAGDSFDALLRLKMRQRKHARAKLNVAFLGDVIETLLAHMQATGLAFPMDLVWVTVNRVLPPTRAYRLKMKFRRLRAPDVDAADAKSSQTAPQHHHPPPPPPHDHTGLEKGDTTLFPPKIPPKRSAKTTPGLTDPATSETDDSDMQEGCGSRKRRKLVSSSTPSPSLTTRSGSRRRYLRRDTDHERRDMDLELSGQVDGFLLSLPFSFFKKHLFYFALGHVHWLQSVGPYNSLPEENRQVK